MRKTRNLDSATKQKISTGLKKYWSTIPTANQETKQSNSNNNKSSNEIPLL